MKAQKIHIDTKQNDYWFYNCDIKFGEQELTITSEDATCIIKVSEITGLKIDTED